MNTINNYQVPNTLPVLYKKSKSGAVEQWTIKTGILVDSAYYHIEYGEAGGKMQEKKNAVSPKNVGRSNETTPIEQANLEAESRWKKQLDKGYTRDLSGQSQRIAKLPMLAKEYKDHKDKVIFPAFVQPKYDGVRAECIKVGKKAFLYSRKGKAFSLTHLTDEIDKISELKFILDGELYTHNATFQEITSWCKKEGPDTKRLKYRVYDVMVDEPYSERYKKLLELKASNLVEVAETIVVNSHEEIVAAADKFEKEGYEGAMVRWGDEGYEINHRSKHLLKVKKFISEEFEIIGYEENTNSPNQCSFILKTAKGHEFKAKPEGTTEHRESLYANAEEIVGKFATVKFFEWTTSEQSVPRFPILLTIRDYE